MDGNLPINGHYYQRTIPDTLDLAERARLALNGLGGTIDTEMGTNYFFIVYGNRRPIYAITYRITRSIRSSLAAFPCYAS